MKYEKKPLECRGEPYDPPRSIEETVAIIEKARKRLGRTLSRRTTARRLVLDNLPIIEDLRERGYKQEDAVLLILELTNDAHKPDTIRKAIAAELGPWSNSVDYAAEPVATPEAKVDNPADAKVGEHEASAGQVRYDNDVNEGDEL